MKAIHSKVNIVPVIAKADTLTLRERDRLKRRVGFIVYTYTHTHTYTAYSSVLISLCYVSTYGSWKWYRSLALIKPVMFIFIQSVDVQFSKAGTLTNILIIAKSLIHPYRQPSG